MDIEEPISRPKSRGQHLHPQINFESYSRRPHTGPLYWFLDRTVSLPQKLTWLKTQNTTQRNKKTFISNTTTTTKQHHYQHIQLGCQNLRWPWTVAASDVEPKNWSKVSIRANRCLRSIPQAPCTSDLPAEVTLGSEIRGKYADSALSAPHPPKPTQSNSDFSLFSFLTSHF